jgi:N-acetylglucosamine kinase-like BadF-type ATPase
MADLLIALEGGGTRSQAVLLDRAGSVLGIAEAGDVNTNFTSFEQAQQAVVSAVAAVLAAAGADGAQAADFALALVGPQFGAETFARLCPNARYHYYNERDVVFARAGFYRPHGVAVVAATGATSWGVRVDDGRKMAVGGWGSLLGDEGSAYAAGLLGLRAAARAYEGRLDLPTRLVDGLCAHLGLTPDSFHSELVRLAYAKPLSRAEIAGMAQVVTRLAAEGDPAAARITAKVAQDLANLALHVACSLFTPAETFAVAGAGGLFNAGEMIAGPLREQLAVEFPASQFVIGTAAPALALGRLALRDIQELQEKPC